MKIIEEIKNNLNELFRKIQQEKIECERKELAAQYRQLYRSYKIQLEIIKSTDW